MRDHRVNTYTRRHDTARGFSTGSMYRTDADCSCGWGRSFHGSADAYDEAQRAVRQHQSESYDYAGEWERQSSTQYRQG